MDMILITPRATCKNSGLRRGCGGVNGSTVWMAVLVAGFSKELLGSVWVLMGRASELSAHGESVRELLVGSASLTFPPH